MPDQPGDPAVAQARALDKLGKRVDVLAREVQGMASLREDLTKVARAQAAKAKAAAPPSWLTVEDPVAAGALLRDLADWLDQVYLRYGGSDLPTCWGWHPDAIEELLWLQAAYAAAYHPETGSVGAASDWHERQRPGVVARLSAAYGSCEVSEHQPGQPASRAAITAPLKHALDDIAFRWTEDRSTPQIYEFDEEQADLYRRRMRAHLTTPHHDQEQSHRPMHPDLKVPPRTADGGG